jgi:energy-coupling factor transporter ATP-binding protein EcfA2
MEALRNIVVVGESGSGKSTVVKGLLNSIGGRSVPAFPQPTEASEDGFWGYQGKGEAGDLEYNGLNLHIEEVIGSRSRMGNTIMSVSSAKTAHCIVFCYDRSRFGLSRVIRYIIQSKNEHVKLILAQTKNPEQNPIPAEFAEFPVYRVNTTSLPDFLPFIVDTMNKGEPAVAIQKRITERKQAEEAAAKAKEAAAAALEAETLASIQTLEQVAATQKAAPTLKKRKNDQGIVGKVVELFSQGNKVAEDNQEIAPLA